MTLTHPAAERELSALLAGTTNATDPETLAARRVLDRAVRRRDPLLLDGGLAAWKLAWDAGLRASLCAPTACGRLHTNTLARAVLRLQGNLHGPDIELRPRLVVAVGEHLTVTIDGFLEIGTPAEVIAIDPAHQTVTLDVPTAPLPARITFGEASHLRYSYATEPVAREIEATPGWLRDQGLAW